MTSPSRLFHRFVPLRAPLEQLVLVLLVLTVSAGVGAAASSSGGGMPWEGPLSQVMNSVTGPVAKALGVIAICALGLGIAFSEGGSMLRKALSVVLGLTILFSAGSWGLSFVSKAGGLLV
jgi:type IV secretion system protein VirB2